jgi:hypothetical protein
MLFNRDVELLYNPTYGSALDVYISKRGKPTKLKRNIVQSIVEQVTEALINSTFDKVVIVSHSQGTILVSEAVRKMIETRDDRLRQAIQSKLELYYFANMSSMYYVLYLVN